MIDAEKLVERLRREVESLVHSANEWDNGIDVLGGPDFRASAINITSAAALIEQQREALKGAAVIANEAGAEIRALKARVAELEANSLGGIMLTTLFDVLMQQNIVTGAESYLALKCVGVPPTDADFVKAVELAIDAALPQKQGKQ